MRGDGMPEVIAKVAVENAAFSFDDAFDYAIPQSLLGMTTEALPGAGAPAQEAAQPAAAEEPACDAPAEAEDAAAKAPAGESSPDAEPAAQDASSDAPENAGQDGEEGKQGEPV